MQDVEERALNSLTFKPLFYYRYVDDIILATKSNTIDTILNMFNSIHERLKFTIEIAKKNRISFLDLSLIIEGSHITCDWYQKNTDSGRYINFHSQHPISQKRSIILNLVDRIILLSHPKFQQNNFIKIINILLNNCFPLQYIINNINNRIKYHIHRKNNSEANNTKDEFYYFTIPYIKNISDKFNTITKEYNLRLSYASFDRLNCFIKTQKDTIEKLDKNAVVYKIDCMDCNASYVGQTKRYLKTRIREHDNDIKKVSNPSVISSYRINYGHQFDWKNVTILDCETSYKKRLISEMVFINRQINGLNKQEDTELLSDSYGPILDTLPLV